MNIHTARSLFKSDAVIIAMVPLLGICLSTIYEAGRLSYYAIPLSFVHVDAPQIAATSLAIAVVFIVLLSLMDVALALVAGKHPMRRALAFPVAIFIFFLPFVYFVPGPSAKWWLLIGFTILIAVTVFVPPTFSKSDGKGYLQRLSKQLDQDYEKTANNSSERLGVKNIISVTFFFGVLVFFIGRYQSEEKSSYLFLKGTNFFLVSDYGDTFIFMLLNESSTAGGEILVKRSNSNLRLVRKRIVIKSPIEKELTGSEPEVSHVFIRPQPSGRVAPRAKGTGVN